MCNYIKKTRKNKSKNKFGETKINSYQLAFLASLVVFL